MCTLICASRLPSWISCFSTHINYGGSKSNLLACCLIGPIPINGVVHHPKWDSIYYTKKNKKTRKTSNLVQMPQVLGQWWCSLSPFFFCLLMTTTSNCMVGSESVLFGSSSLWSNVCYDILPIHEIMCKCWGRLEIKWTKYSNHVKILHISPMNACYYIFGVAQCNNSLLKSSIFTNESSIGCSTIIEHKMTLLATISHCH